MSWFSRPKQKALLFNPKEDITPHELAMCLKIILGGMQGINVIKDMPESVTRHWLETEQ